MTRAQITRILGAPHDATGAEVGQMARDYLRLLDRVEGELNDHSQAVREGMERARRRGAIIGRPVLDLDLSHAIKLWTEGYSVRAVAEETGIHRSTLRRRFAELGLLGGER